MDVPRDRDTTYDDPVYGEYAAANEVLKYKKKPVGTLEVPKNIHTPGAEDEDDVRPRGTKRFLAEIFVLFEHETSSPWARIVSAIVTFVILIAIVSYILSSLTMDQYTPTTCDAPACDHDRALCSGKQVCEPQQLPGFDAIEVISVFFFTIEYGLRITTCWTVSARLSGILPSGWDKTHKPADQPRYSTPTKILKYALRSSNLIDLVAIMPYYLGLVVPSGNESFIRVLRLFRLVRVLRLLRMLSFLKNVDVTIELLSLTVQNSAQILAVFLFFVIITVILFSCIIYLCESGEFMVTVEFPAGAYLRPTIDGRGLEVSPFDSIPTGLWWAVVSSGSLNTNTDAGRLVSCVMVLVSLFGLAFPVSVIAMEFERAYNQDSKGLLIESQATARRLAEDLLSMRGLDVDNEAVRIVRKIRVPPSAKAVHVCGQIDALLDTERAKVVALRKLLAELLAVDADITLYKDSQPAYDQHVPDPPTGSRRSLYQRVFGKKEASSSDDGSGGQSTQPPTKTSIHGGGVCEQHHTWADHLGEEFEEIDLHEEGYGEGYSMGGSSPRRNDKADDQPPTALTAHPLMPPALSSVLDKVNPLTAVNALLQPVTDALRLDALGPGVPSGGSGGGSNARTPGASRAPPEATHRQSPWYGEGLSYAPAAGE